MVSVCMASYNGARYIRTQVESILPELGPDDELVVSDDCSTDGTWEILKDYARRDSRVRVFRNEEDKSKFGGSLVKIITSNFVNAINHSQGDIIFFSDQDDKWVSGKVSKCLQVLKEQQADVVVHDAMVTDGELNVVSPSYFGIVRMRPGFWSNFIKFRYIGCCMVVRREVIDKLARPFVLSMYHDLWITLLAEVKGKVVPIREPLIYYRRHGDNASTASEKSTNSLWKKFMIRVPFMYHVAARLLKISLCNRK